MRHLVAYHGNRYVDHFQRDLDEMAGHGFTGVVHCVTEADLEWGMGRVEQLFTLTRGAGMECWADPWGAGGVFGGEAHSGFLARHPDAHQVASDGRSLPHACLRHPEFLAFMESWLEAVGSAGAEWVFWDEPHVGFTGDESWACACDSCAAALGHRPERVDEAVLDFRQSTSLEFLDRMSAHAASKGMRNSVCLYPLPPDRARRLGIPAIAAVAALDAVDDIAVDPYPVFLATAGTSYADFDADRFVGGWADRLREAAGDAQTSCHLWIQGFALPAGFEHLVEECATAARAHGVEDLAFWSYRAAENTSSIAPADPAAVWAAAKRAFAPTGGTAPGIAGREVGPPS